MSLGIIKKLAGLYAELYINPIGAAKKKERKELDRLIKEEVLAWGVREKGTEITIIRDKPAGDAFLGPSGSVSIRWRGSPDSEKLRKLMAEKSAKDKEWGDKINKAYKKIEEWKKKALDDIMEKNDIEPFIFEEGN